MNHHELQESLGAYALDALDADEAELVTRHLAVCPRCRAEATAHRETAALLGNFGAQAPDGVWDRIAADISGMAPEDAPSLAPSPTPPPALRALPRLDVPPAPGAGPGPERDARTGADAGISTVVPLAAKRRRVTPARWRAAALAAAAAIVVAFMGISVARLDRHVSELRAAVSAGAQERAASAVVFSDDHRQVRLRSGDGEVSADVVVAPSGDAYVVASQLPTLAVGRTYQLWGLVDGRVVSLGLLGRSPRLASFRVDANVSQLMVTAEPAGGVVVPDSPVLMEGRVPSA